MICRDDKDQLHLDGNNGNDKRGWCRQYNILTMMIIIFNDHKYDDDHILPIGPKLNFSTTNPIVNQCHHRCKSQKKITSTTLKIHL